LVSAALAATPAEGIIVLGTRQVVSSADYLPGGRAQYVGRFGNYLGTPIAPRYFITATHLGNAGGGVFFYRNGTANETMYTVTLAGTRDDLAIWRVSGSSPPFTRYAPLYTSPGEVGRPVQLLGRGTQRGAEVRVPDTATGALKGWRWGAGDGLVTAGTNTVASVENFGASAPPGFAGDFLYLTFDQGAAATEGTCSVGDSGGPAFITDPADGLVKLAGINSLVDGQFSYSASGPFFDGAISDARGLYVGGVGGSSYIDPAGASRVPTGTYATRIASRLAFINGILSTPVCGTADFNNDGDVGTDTDIEAFFACLGGSCCTQCGTADFNGDGDVGTDLDIEAFFRVLGGGNC